MPVKPHQAGYFYFNFLFQLFTATQTKPQSLNGVSRSSVSLLIWTRRICSEGGGGGGRERKDYQQDQTKQSSRSYRETRIQAVCRNYAPIYFIIYSAVNTFIFVLTF